MVKRYRPKPERKPPSPPNRKRLTEKNVLTLPAKGKQYLVWDDSTGKDAAHGLAVLVSPRCVKSYRCVYYFPGSSKPHWKHIGRVGEVSLEEAREATRNARGMARKGEDPKATDPTRSGTFKASVDDYIKEEQKGRRGNKSADATGAVILNNTTSWHTRPVATLTYREISKLLAGIRDGDPDRDLKPRPYLSVRLYSHLRDLFGWLARERQIKSSPMTGMPEPWEGATSRDRVFGDDEVKAIWQAGNSLAPVEEAYVKLILLLGLRRNEMALARWSEFDDLSHPGLFTVPTERVKMKAASKLKKKPVYRTPLPPLAQRILRSIRQDGEDMVFPGLRADRIKNKLVKAGAPDDFNLHTCRHTITTFLENAGHDEFDRGLILNHSSSGVTAGYSHGFALDRKHELLEKWADHIEKLVAPEGATLFR